MLCTRQHVTIVELQTLSQSVILFTNDSTFLTTHKHLQMLTGYQVNCLLTLFSYIYTGWAKKTGLFFRLDNFVMVTPRKACSMSKFSQFYREKGTKLAFQ